MKTLQTIISPARIFRIHFLLFWGLLAFGQLQRFQVTSNIAFYGHEIVLLSWLLSSFKPLIIQIGRHLNALKNNRIGLALLRFLGLQFLLYNLLDFQLIQVLYMMRLTCYFTLFYLFKIGLQRQYITTNHIGKTILTVGTIIGIAGLFQYFFIPDTRFLWFQGWDDHYFRLISTLFDPNFTALILGITLLFYLIESKNETLSDFSIPKGPLRGFPFSKTPTVRSFIIILFFLVTLLLTYSRSGYVALAIGLLSLALLHKHIKPILILLLFIVCIPFLPRPAGEGVKLERTASVESRLESNRSSLQSLSLTEVIVGRGMYRDLQSNQSGLPQHATAPDNSFVFIFTSVGIVGSLLLIATLIHLTKKHHISKKLLPIIAVIFTHSLFNNSLFYIWTISLLIVVSIYFHQPEQNH